MYKFYTATNFLNFRDFGKRILYLGTELVSTIFSSLFHIVILIWIMLTCALKVQVKELKNETINKSCIENISN